ncbi:MAG: hypothetical protein MJE63_20470 [Proteobacteria bacterium]|nr:hypothetical protein [Pseudomonadota bacterium]
MTGVTLPVDGGYHTG